MTHDPGDDDDATWDELDSLDTTDVRTVFELNVDEEEDGYGSLRY